ncbi:plexin-A1-like isoform X2 [Halichondria panicea]|uniref:plexin-A1-like isoform X2 n=1 Tax=Halichondria panicea TaxID=6063 RepID=UPI00312BBACB
MGSRRVLLQLVVVLLSVKTLYCQSFSDFAASPNGPGLQVDSTGRAYLAAGNNLYRLSAQLTPDETVDLGATVITRGLALSSTGTVVVCLVDLSCSVYNGSNLSAGPIRTVTNAIASADPDFGAAIITSGATFYTGASTGAGTVAMGHRMTLQQFGEGFNRSSNNPSPLAFGVSDFSRQFYGGFVSGNFTYYVVSDYRPRIDQTRAIRLLRVCNMPDCEGASTCGVTALYEFGFDCGGRTISERTRVCGVSLVEDFSRISGPTVVITICTPGFTDRSFVCVVDLTAVNVDLDAKYKSCIVSRTASEEIGLAWRTGSSENCDSLLPQVTGDRCDTATPVGVLAPDGGRNNQAPVRVNFAGSPLPTASVAVKMEQFSFVFVATNDLFIRGHDISGAGVSTIIFYNQPVTSTVHQLSWQEGLNYITAATNNSVFRVPIEECSQRMDCTSCTNDPNPLCGWCVVENKCSRQTQCQNSSLSSRWIQDNTICVTATVDPMQLVLDPEIPASVLTVNLTSPGLPALLPGETFSCHVADSEGRFPPIIVPAVEVTQGTVYNCSIAEMVPDYAGVTATINLGFQSSLFNVPFDITNQALIIYRCSAGESCKDCLGPNSPCGWCNLIKQCSGTSAPCRNVSNFLQVSMSTNFIDLCPLLDTPPTGGVYTIPVRVVQDLRLTTRNLIPPTDGFNYSCSVGGVSLTAQYENENSIVCNVGSEKLNLPEGTGSSSVVAMVIWFGNGVTRPLSNIMTQTNVTLFDCRGLGSECADCLASSIGSEFTCGWCKTEGSCEVLQECTMNDFVTEGRNCPAPSINSIDPVSGPVQGGTAITVKGTNLGVTFADIQNSTLTLQNGGCTPIDTDYMPGRQFVCVTIRFELGPGPSAFTMILYGTQTVNAPPFTAVNPGISSVTPTFGPLAGGTTLTVRGNELRAGNHENTAVTLVVDGGSRYPCNININNTIRDVMAQEIRCTTAAGSVPSDTEVVVTIDNATLSFGVVFSYRNNPNVTAVFPSNTVPSGGITLTFTGLNMDVVQQPFLEVYGAMGSRLNSSCVLVNATAITCSTPSLGTTLLTPLNYSLRFDDAPPTTQARLPITVQPDPFNLRLEGSNMATTGTATIINIVGEHLDSVEASEIRVTVGGSECTKTTTSNSRGSEIFCTVPREPPGGVNPAIINVAIGTNISQALERRLSYTTGVVGEVLPLEIIIPSVVGGFAVVVILLVLVMCCIICVYTSKHKKTEQRWTNLLAQMELLEIEMADECKRAFTELQTDLADLVHITDQNLPYRDFRTFAMRFLFPQAGDDHPVLHPLVLPEKSDTEQVATQLNSFRHLIMDKKFLLIFVRTLESQGTQFNLNDRSTVASLLMVCFQDDLDYATEILHLLLAELMRKSMTKNSHPKLMLRRTESVAEKMLANWLAFLLYPYLLEHVGEKLFILFRAIKSQLEKGPVDIITGEAKNSLSEEKLLRHHQRDIKVVDGDGVVVAESGEEFPVRLLDCDSITQSKEKVLDVLYKNTPVSKRPQLTEIDLELISTGAAGIPLRDQDATNTKDGEWIKVNTLGHYKLDEMSQAHADNPKNPVPKFRISRRPERPVSGMSFDMLGTIIANISANNRGSVYMPSDLPHTYHLVKPEPEDPTDGQRGQKIVSEVFLTRLLSTKRILQTYVDELFESVFAVPHGRPLPKAIKSLFDFLDQQAAELGIQDPEILHTWKTNSVPLRFWVNVIKNPDFLFDVNKSATVDSCLTVIAQAYIDACSTTDFKYTKDTPAARLLYVNDVKKYKTGVLQYYGTIQSLPKVSGSDMCQYLRETAQKGQLYFITDSALYELFKFANKFSEVVTDGLKEEGLTIQAASFDQIKRNMRSATHTS